MICEMISIIHFFKKNKFFLIFIILLTILIDILIALNSDDLFRMFINYLFIPGIAIISLKCKRKNYIILLIYELFLALITCFDIIGFSIFTYFAFPSIWYVSNSLILDTEVFGISKWFQPIIILLIVLFVANIVNRRKEKKIENSTIDNEEK